MTGFWELISLNFLFLGKYNFSRLYEIGEHELHCSNSIIDIRIILYHQEVSIEIAKTSDKSNEENKTWTALSWLIIYLTNNKEYESNYFREEVEYNRRIEKQCKYLANVLENHIEPIISFYSSKDFEQEAKKLHNFIIGELKKEGLL